MTHDRNMAPEEGHEVEQDFRGGLLKVVLGVLMLIVLMVLVVGGIRHYFGSKPEVVTTTETTATVEPVPVPVTNVDVEGDFVIKMPPRDGNRLNSEGITVSDDAEAFRRQIAEQAKHDPLTLYLYYNASPLGEKRPLESEAVIAKDGVIKDGNVYSERGVEAYNDWLFLWELADIEAVREITFQGYNTGVDGSKVTKSNGVGGTDKAGYDVAYRDVSGEVTHEHSALKRCTQPTFGGPIPWVPEGPTDCPPPTPTTKEVKGPNPYPDTVEKHQSSVPVPPATPGYTPDNAEKVVKEQEKSHPGNRTPTPSGTDSGSTTNPTNSQTTNPDGSTATAPIGTEVEYTPPSEETVPPDDQSGFDPYDVP